MGILGYCNLSIDTHRFHMCYVFMYAVFDCTVYTVLLWTIKCLHVHSSGLRIVKSTTIVFFNSNEIGYQVPNHHNIPLSFWAFIASDVYMVLCIHILIPLQLQRSHSLLASVCGNIIG